MKFVEYHHHPYELKSNTVFAKKFTTFLLHALFSQLGKILEILTNTACEAAKYVV